MSLKAKDFKAYGKTKDHNFGRKANQGPRTTIKTTVPGEDHYRGVESTFDFVRTKDP